MIVIDEGRGHYFAGNLTWLNFFAATPLSNARRLILSHHKHLNMEAYLIDDRVAHNVSDKFKGAFIHFSSDKFPNWDMVIKYLIPSNYFSTRTFS